MKHSFIFVVLFSFSILGFTQQDAGIRVFGRIPDASDNRLYQIQVGAFKVMRNAEAVFQRLQAHSLNPSYENYMDFTRVIVKGIRAADMPSYIERIRRAGFSEIFIKIDSGATANTTTAQLPVSTAALPSTVLREIAHCSVKVGETKSLADIVNGRNVTSWTSSTPSSVRVDANGNITGVAIGNAYININESEYVSVVVVPAENFYLVPESMESLLPAESKASISAYTEDLTEYRTEPTFRLSYRFNNKGEHRGASGENGGIDILGRGHDYEWLWTTFRQGGWFYDLNETKHEMIDGYQKDPRNGVELTVKPEFVYDNGVAYLQLKHVMRNSSNAAVTGQRFGASADVMIHENDNAPLIHTPYGAYMTDSEAAPSLQLMFVCESGDGINPVDTLWLGEYDWGAHLNNIYVDQRSDIRGVDSAIGFSYQNIDLAPGEEKEFIVRFTLARTED